MNKFSTFDMVLVSLFTALTAIGAFIKIYITPDIPYSAQDLFVIMAGIILGARLGAISQLIYILIGLAGIPVFTAGGGFSYIFNPTFGYLIGFIFGAFVIGLIINKKSSFAMILTGALAGVAVIYLIGVPYMYLILKLYLGKNITLNYALQSGALFFLPKDILFCFIAAAIANPLKKALTVMKTGLR